MADKNENAGSLLEQMVDAGSIVVNEDGTVTITAQENRQEVMGNDKEY
jgi:hypothetical protein